MSWLVGKIGSRVLWGAVGVILSLWGGWHLGKSMAERATAECERAALKAELRMAVAARRDLEDAQQKSDQLLRELQAARRERTTLARRLQNEVLQTTRERACFGDDTLRLLDRAPGLQLSSTLGGLAGPASGEVATDTDLARWAIAAGAAYRACHDQLSALIDWHERESP